VKDYYNFEEIEKKWQKKWDDESLYKTKNKDEKDHLKSYTQVFYNKNKEYFKKNNNIIAGDRFYTKIINMPKHNKEEESITINKIKLLNIELEDLLK
jgi:hypothetical protein